MKFRTVALSFVLACALLALAACAPELDWRELSVPEARFSVLLPGKASRETRTLNTAAGALTMTMYAFSLKQGTMAVAYTDYPAAALAGEHAREQLNAERDALLRNIGASKHSEEDVLIAGLPGRQVLCRRPYRRARRAAESAFRRGRQPFVSGRLRRRARQPGDGRHRHVPHFVQAAALITCARSLA